LDKREQIAISLAGTISNMKVIEEASPNPIPIKAKTNYCLPYIPGCGPCSSCFIVFGIEVINDKDYEQAGY
jgi:hypothetical protein